MNKYNYYAMGMQRHGKNSDQKPSTPVPESAVTCVELVTVGSQLAANEYFSNKLPCAA